MPACAVATCKNYIKTEKSSDLSFHRFPKDPSIRKQWVYRCSRKDKFNPSNGKICSNHFSPSDYESSQNNSKRKLKKSAIPSFNLPHQFSTTNSQPPQIIRSTEKLPVGESEQKTSSSDMIFNSNSIIPNSSIDPNLNSNSDIHTFPNDHALIQSTSQN